ncbi:hypothetical protein [Ekhidna sp.]|uniref:hypothetical protein n=1 Tax=Ekhidna sp. TaxID=2608089 RepID=UPI003CCBB6ED
MNNNILKLSLVTVRVLRVIFFVLAILLCFFFISHLLGIPLGIQYIWTDSGLSFNKEGEGIEQSFLHLTFSFAKNLIQILITLLLLSRAIKIIESIKHLKAFVSENILHFKKMGAFFIMLFLVDLISLLPANSGTMVHLEAKLLYPICALVCFLLSEIFTEGNRLYEENELTV